MELLEFMSSGNSLLPYFDISTYSSKPWELLLPINIGDNFYRYTTTGLVLMAGIQKIWTYLFNSDVSIYLTFFTLSTILIFTTFVTAWKATRSKAFTITLTICIAFGTQFNGLYSNSSIMILYLFYTFIEINLLCLYLIMISKEPSVKLKIYFTLSLICVALCWEMWLDYAVFLFCAVGILFIMNKKLKLKEQFSKLKYIFESLCIILVIYLAIKVNTSQGISEHFENGKESESVLNYLKESESGTSAIVIEDIVSNAITYNYISFTNYFPPILLSSNSLYYLGNKTSQFQHGYDKGSNHFIYYHYVFYWYFFAGALFVLVILLTYKVGKKLWSDPSSQFHLVVLITLSMIIFGSFTHLLIKYRPYLSVPLLGYKCIVSTFGVTMLIGLSTFYFRRKISIKKYYFVLAIVWAAVIYGGFYRPERLSHLGKEVMPGTLYESQPNPINGTPLKNYYKATHRKDASEK